MSIVSKNRIHLNNPLGMFILPEFAVKTAERNGMTIEDLLNPAVAARLLSVNNMAKSLVLADSFEGWFPGTDRIALHSLFYNTIGVNAVSYYFLSSIWMKEPGALPAGFGNLSNAVDVKGLISTAYALRNDENLKTEVAREFILQKSESEMEHNNLEGISFRILPNYGVAVIVAPRGPYTTEVRTLFLKALFKTLMQTYTIEELAGTKLFEQYLGCLSSGQ